MSCECCRMIFPDDDTKRDYVQRYCASLEGWETCSIARSLLEFYERMDEHGEKRGQDQATGA